MAPVCGFAAYPRIEVGWTVQPSTDLQRGDPRLVVGESPDAAEGLEQADEEQAGNPRMHHLQVQRRRLGQVPTGDLLRQERKAGSKSGCHDDRVELVPRPVGESDRPS